MNLDQIKRMVEAEIAYHQQKAERYLVVLAILEEDVPGTTEEDTINYKMKKLGQAIEAKAKANGGPKKVHRAKGLASSQVVAAITAPMRSGEIWRAIYGANANGAQKNVVYQKLHYLKSTGQLQYDGEYYSKPGTPANE